MKQFLLSIIFFSATSLVLAQEKILTMEDALVKNRTTLAPENLAQLQFIYGTNDYVYLKKGEKEWIRGNFKNQEYSFLTLEKLNSILKKNDLPTLNSMPRVQFNKSNGWIMLVNGSKITLDPLSGKARTIINKSIVSKDIMDESNTGYIAYVDSFNLYVAEGKNVHRVTNDGSRDIVYGSSVHRDEFGITKGTFWSSNGKNLAFYRMDQSMVTDYPIIDWSVRPAKNVNIKYPMAGDQSHHVTVGVYNAETQRLIYLKTGLPAEQYSTNIAWSPDDRYIYIAVLITEY